MWDSTKLTKKRYEGTFLADDRALIKIQWMADLRFVHFIVHKFSFRNTGNHPTSSSEKSSLHCSLVLLSSSHLLFRRLLQLFHQSPQTLTKKKIHCIVSLVCPTMSDVAMDTSSEITAKDLKEKEVVKEAENGRDTPTNGTTDEKNGKQLTMGYMKKRKKKGDLDTMRKRMEVTMRSLRQPWAQRQLKMIESDDGDTRKQDQWGWLGSKKGKVKLKN